MSMAPWAESFPRTRSLIKMTFFISYACALNILCLTFSQVLNKVILDVKKIDEKSQIPFKQLLKSRLLQIFTFPYVPAAIIMPSSFYVLTAIVQTPLQAATSVAEIFLIASVITPTCRYMIAQKILHFTFPRKSLGKYVIASATMATILTLIPHPQKLRATSAITFLREQFIWQHCWQRIKREGN